MKTSNLFAAASFGLLAVVSVGCNKTAVGTNSDVDAYRSVTVGGSRTIVKIASDSLGNNPLSQCGGAVRAYADGLNLHLSVSNVANCSNFIIDGVSGTTKLTGPETSRGGDFILSQIPLSSGEHSVHITVRSNSGAHYDAIDINYVVRHQINVASKTIALADCGGTASTQVIEGYLEDSIQVNFAGVQNCSNVNLNGGQFVKLDGNTSGTVTLRQSQLNNGEAIFVLKSNSGAHTDTLDINFDN